MNYSGNLVIRVKDEEDRPVSGANVNISTTGEPQNIIERLDTNVSGNTESVELEAPDESLSLDRNNLIQPYSEYDIYVTARGFEAADVSGIEILAQTSSYIEVKLRRDLSITQGAVVIPAHTLYGDYPPKIPESEIKDMGSGGEIVLSRVVVPQTVIVHDGVPSDSTAKDYYVPYTDYIKNVACSEIYATWPQSAIVANVLAILSFTLNRVYTEWYRNKGYNFTITSSTAYDHKWMYGRNIYDNISQVVDEIFDQYISRPNVKQPILTQYCDGQRTTCPGAMSQWGSKSLGDNGLSPIEILRNYYGSDVYINSAEQIAGIPSSWPGNNLDVGSRGDKVRQIQEQLDTIAEVYSAIPRIANDGIYGNRTKDAVKSFQDIFGLPSTGVVDFSTWYKISQIYVGISRIGEL